MNSVVLIGRLTRDPEVRYTASQLAVASFNVAIDRPPRQNGEKGADFPRVTVFGRQAENCEKYLAKGRLVGIQGRIQTGSYQNKNGDTVYTTDVIADRVEFLEWGDRPSQNNSSNERNSFSNGGFAGNQSQGSANNSNNSNMSEAMPDSFEHLEDDIPF